MPSFFYICEYLGVTPQEFFDEGNSNPEALNEFIAQARQLDSRSFEYILGIIKELNTKRKSGRHLAALFYSTRQSPGYALSIYRRKTKICP